jgi:hypothetical protein
MSQFFDTRGVEMQKLKTRIAELEAEREGWQINAEQWAHENAVHYKKQLAERDAEVARWKSAFEIEQKVADQETQQAFKYARQIALLREALTECMVEADDYEARTGKKLVGEWPDKARAALAATEEKK